MKQFRWAALLILVLLVASGAGRAEDRKLLRDLRGEWKFNIGDDKRRAELQYDDSKWEQIFVPSPWEDEGFPGYDGYGWYRKHFQAPAEWKGKVLYVHLGKVDDVDEVYVNGNFLGMSGSFPPNYVTAYNVERRYVLPESYLNFNGDNVIAVRVYDSQLEGGITHGKVGVYEDVKGLRVDLTLPGIWKFTTGDNVAWKDVRFDDSRWKDVHVPAYWETQGYRDYDGFAWYRLKFEVPSSLLNHQLIMILGRIDDLDETFLNGERIGHTGDINSTQRPIPVSGTEYKELRAYTIPGDILRPNQENVLAVRVYDNYLQGGIYDGPVGIVTRDHYLQWKSVQKKEKSLWDRFDQIFR